MSALSEYGKKLHLFLQRYKLTAKQYARQIGEVGHNDTFLSALAEVESLENSAGTEPTAVKAAPDELDLIVGERVDLYTAITPEVARQIFSFTLSAQNIVTIVEDGVAPEGNKKWLIIAQAPGSVTATFKAADDTTKTKTVSITVHAIGS